MKSKNAVFIITSIVLLSTAVTVAAQETLVQSIVRHRDFFLFLHGYDECMLVDVEVLDRGEAIGVVLLSAEGFEQNLVFKMSNMLQIYTKSRVLDKESRELLSDTGIRMSDVKKLAYAAKIRAAERARGSMIHEGKPGNIIIR